MSLTWRMDTTDLFPIACRLRLVVEKFFNYAVDLATESFAAKEFFSLAGGGGLGRETKVAAAPLQEPGGGAPASAACDLVDWFEAGFETGKANAFRELGIALGCVEDAAA